MAANCPHCNESIEALSGFVTQAKLEERLKAQGEAKDGEIAALRTKVSEQATAIEATAGAAAELETLRAQVASRDQRDARLTALAEAKIDAGLLDSIEVLYQSATAGQGDEAKDFAAWLAEDAASHPLLAPHLSATSTTKPGGATNETQTVNRLGTTDTATGTPPGPNTGKLKPEDVAAYFESAEFKGMSREDQRAKVVELREQVQAQG